MLVPLLESGRGNVTGINTGLIDSSSAFDNRSPKGKVTKKGSFDPRSGGLLRAWFDSKGWALCAKPCPALIYATVVPAEAKVQTGR